MPLIRSRFSLLARNNIRLSRLKRCGSNSLPRSRPPRNAHKRLTDWDKLSQGTKNSMLQGQAGQDLRDLARLAEGARDAGRFRNVSGTARAVDGLSYLTEMLSPLAIKRALGEGALGLTMASPNVARAAVRMGEVRPIAKSAAALSKLGQYVAPVAANGVGPSLGDIK